MPPPASSAPPLWIWGASVALAAALVGATLPGFLAHQAQVKHVPTVMDIDIAKFANSSRDPSRLRVIAFGDSALATAVLQGKKMDSYTQERTGADVSFLLLWRPWCLLHQVLGSVDAAVATSPDVVMLDTWILVYAPDRNSTRAYAAFIAEHPDVVASLQRIADQPSLVFDHQAFLFDTLTGSTEGQQRIEDLPLPEAGRGADLRCDAAARRQKIHTAELRYPPFQDLTVTPELRHVLDTLLDHADAHGVRVVFFDIPKAPPIESLPGVRRKRALTRDLLHEYVKRGRLDYFEFDGQIAEADTCDDVHYTASGRELYLPWFADRLAQLPRER